MYIKNLIIGLIFTMSLNCNAEVIVDNNFKNLLIVNHPLAQDKLSILRDKDTGIKEFKDSLAQISVFIGYEIAKELKTKKVKIATPVSNAIAEKVAQEIVIVPILRAGLGMARGLETLFPSAKIGYIGLYRDAKTQKAVEYFFKVPKFENQLFILVDPMLATGNSIIHAIDKLVDAKIPVENIILMTLVVVPEGMTNLVKSYPNIKVYTATLDQKLNSHKYIVPGLGDAGDRLYGE